MWILIWGVSSVVEHLHNFWESGISLMFALVIPLILIT